MSSEVGMILGPQQGSLCLRLFVRWYPCNSCHTKTSCKQSFGGQQHTPSRRRSEEALAITGTLRLAAARRGARQSQSVTQAFGGAVVSEAFAVEALVQLKRGHVEAVRSKQT